MRQLFNFFKRNIFVVLLLILAIPTFYRMLPSGMYSTQDFHLFRLFEFSKCVQSRELPCRWAPDAGLGYGEPLFNFYGQFVYAVGEIFHLIGFSLINSIKILFILSLLGSGVAMYFLAKTIWKNNYSAIISSVVYLYAPYRAVDVWVRGALPEAFSFTLFPLILLSIEKKKLIWFSVLFSILILTHNLSAVMFLPVIVVWIVYRRFWKAIIGGIISFLISAFYILPVIFESKFIDLGSTITGYFDFHNHFVTSYELFISNFWGYGASVWGPNDGLSLAIGYIQWILPVLILMVLVLKKKLFKNVEFLILFLAGWFYIFLTHNKSTFIWEHSPFMAYIQFPWRFLGIVVFCFSLASGLIVDLFDKLKTWIVLAVCALVIGLNLSFFRGDIWYKVDDSYYLTGAEWVRQRAASIQDFWPNFGHAIPSTPSDGKFINYFPGWIGVLPDVNGLIPKSGAYFTDTPVRRWGNIISLTSIIILSLSLINKKWIGKH